MQDYGKLEWKRNLSDLEKALDVAYQDVLNEFDSTWGVKSLIMNHSNLVVIWLLFLDFQLVCVGSHKVVHFGSYLTIDFLICVEKKKKRKEKMIDNWLMCRPSSLVVVIANQGLLNPYNSRLPSSIVLTKNTLIIRYLLHPHPIA